MDDFRWENHAIRTARAPQRERRRSLTKKLMVYYEANATAVNIRGLTGFSAEGVSSEIELARTSRMENDRNRM